MDTQLSQFWGSRKQNSLSKNNEKIHFINAGWKKMQIPSQAHLQVN